MEIFPAARFGQRFEPCPPVGRTHRTVKEPFRKSSEVEARPTHQDGDLAPLPDVLENRPSLAGIVTRREEIRRIADIDHVVGNLLPLGKGGFGTPDIETAEDLDGVVVNDLAVEVLGNG